MPSIAYSRARMRWVLHGPLVTAAAVILSLCAADSARAGGEFHKVLGQVTFTLADAVRVVQQAYDGYAIEAELEAEHGMYYYRVELVDAGGRTDVFVNPANGLVIGVEREEGIAVRLRSRWERELSAAQSAKLTLLDAISTAGEASHGHVIAADFRTYRNPPSYFIRIISGDTEHEVSLAPETGAVLAHDIGG